MYTSYKHDKIYTSELYSFQHVQNSRAALEVIFNYMFSEGPMRLNCYDILF